MHRFIVFITILILHHAQYHINNSQVNGFDVTTIDKVGIIGIIVLCFIPYFKIGGMIMTTSKVPIYQQIKNYLEELIRQNSSNPQFKLPSENQLSLKFNTSRIPAKRALQELETEGFIYRQQGKGSFIKQKNGNDGERLSVCLFLPHTSAVYFYEMISGIQDFFKSVDAELYITVTGNDSLIEEKMVYSALNKQFHGLLVFPVVYHTYNDALLKLVLRRFPIVFLGRPLPGLNISSVCCDHYLQAYHATEYLIKNGHKDIGFISESGESSLSYLDRLRGYRNCIHEHLSQRNIHQMEVDFFYGSSAEDLNSAVDSAINRFFQIHRDISAVITTSNAVERLCAYLTEHNISEDEITIMIFDKPERNMDLGKYHPIIIDQQPTLIGYKAAEQLYKQITTQSDVQHITIEERLIIK